MVKNDAQPGQIPSRGEDTRQRAQFQARAPLSESETSSIIDTVTAPKVAPKKRAKAAPKEYPPHEHFGSPLNICRVCGEKYTYVQKPYDHAPKA